MSTEKEPKVNIRFGEKTAQLGLDRIFLYTFVGKSAVQIDEENSIEIDNSAVNHVWAKVSDTSGVFFWREYQTDMYNTLENFVRQNEGQMMLNLRHVPVTDVQQWLVAMDTATQKFVSGIPDFLE